MSEQEKPIEGEVVRETAVAIPDARAVTLASGDPTVLIEQATRQADALKRIIDTKRLYKEINGRRHVFVEGWQTLGALNGLLAYTETVTVQRVTDGERTFIEAVAVVSARRSSDGAPIARAEGFCSTRETRWANRDEYAVRSMAQTRATGKVFRDAFAWVMVLAGYDATPSDEIPADPPPPERTGDPVDSAVIGTIADAKRAKSSDAESEAAVRKVIVAFLEEKGYRNWQEFAEHGAEDARALLDRIEHYAPAEDDMARAARETFDPESVPVPAGEKVPEPVGTRPAKKRA